VLFGFSNNIIEHLIETVGNRFGRTNIERMSIFFGKYHERSQSFFVGLVMYPIRERNRLVIHFDAGNFFGYMSIGE